MWAIFSNFGRGTSVIAKCTFYYIFQSVKTICAFYAFFRWSICRCCVIHQYCLHSYFTRNPSKYKAIRCAAFHRIHILCKRAESIDERVICLNKCTADSFAEICVLSARLTIIHVIIRHRKLIAFTRNINLTNFVAAEHFSLSVIYYPCYYFRYKLVWKDLFILWILVDMPM